MQVDSKWRIPSIALLVLMTGWLSARAEEIEWFIASISKEQDRERLVCPSAVVL